MSASVGDPGFDLRGGVDFVNGGWGVENHWKCWWLKVKFIFSVFLAIFLLQLWLTWIASEASEKKVRKNSVLVIKNRRSAAVRGGARRMRPPGSASELCDLCIGLSIEIQHMGRKIRIKEGFLKFKNIVLSIQLKANNKPQCLYHLFLLM